MQNINMLLTLHPTLKKADLLRSSSMSIEKEEIKKLTEILKSIQGNNPFKTGKIANVINKTYHQQFFNPSLKLNTIDNNLENLKVEDKLYLLERVIDRFLEVDLEKQKKVISSKNKKKIRSTENCIQNFEKRMSLAKKRNFKYHRNTDSQSESEDYIDSNEYEMTGSEISPFHRRNKTLNKIKFGNNVSISEAVKAKKEIYEKEKERYNDVEVNIISSGIKSISKKK